MNTDSIWSRLGRTTLNIVTLGATGKVETIEAEAKRVEAEYTAAYHMFENLRERVRGLAEQRGEVNREAHLVLGRIIDLLVTLGKANFGLPGRNYGREISGY